MTKSLLVIICLLVATHYHGVHGACSGLSYALLEDSLRNYPNNMEMLVNAFFPTDHPSRTVVDVSYTILVIPSGEEFTTVTTNHRVLRDVEYINDTEIQFRWMASSIVLLFEPLILERLSLFADVGKANLTLNISRECFQSEPVTGEKACKEKHIVNGLLSELTSNVSNVDNLQR